MCNFEVSTLARQKLHRVAVTEMACVNGPLKSYVRSKIYRVKGQSWKTDIKLVGVGLRSITSRCREMSPHSSPKG